MPTLDDNFISNATEFETVEEYRKDLTAHIQTMKSKDQEQEFEYNMRNFLLENTKIEIPESMVENEVSYNVSHLKEALSAYGMSVEDYLAQTGVGTLQDYIARVKENAIHSIKARCIYRKLIEANKISVSEKELNSAVAGNDNEDEKIKKENELLLKKLFSFLKENVKLEILPEEECHCHC